MRPPLLSPFNVCALKGRSVKSLPFEDKVPLGGHSSRMRVSRVSSLSHIQIRVVLKVVCVRYEGRWREWRDKFNLATFRRRGKGRVYGWVYIYVIGDMSMWLVMLP